uniref:Bromo domain-containing protein n=2 Tax=Zea mays TaxID=4577 RepID=A0A804LJQ2_MAIZE
MSGKGKRRSARLLKLEEQKNDGGAVCFLDPWQIIRNSISGPSARGKRKRNEGIQPQGEASCSRQEPLYAGNSNSLPSQTSVGQIIEYILDELEMRDRHELFAMPDDIQVTDYAELVSRPGDFATLRQKNRDGMYTALEQFENDVYMVFQKAITMNSQDTVPFREGMALLDQAKLVFMSLRSNQMFSESELAAWRQRHADQMQQPITPEGREGGGRGPPRHTAAAPLLQPSAATPRKRSAAETKKQEDARTGGNATGNQRGRPRGARETKATAPTPPGKRARKATAGFNGGRGLVARRRLTYNDEAAADQGWREIAATPVFQGRHVTLRDQPQEQTFRGSLQRFVRHAGLKARVAAEFRSLECVARARHCPVPQCWNGFAPSAGFLPPSPRPPGAAAAEPGTSSDQQAAAPECKLETDEVLKLFVLMGTPAAFLSRAKKMFGQDEPEKSAQPAKAADDARARAGAATTAETGHGKKSSASEPSAAACGPFAPPKLVPGRLGFGQFAASSARPFKLNSKPSASNDSGKKKLQ